MKYGISLRRMGYKFDVTSIANFVRKPKRDSPATWNRNWPWGSEMGILGGNEAIEPMAWKNRQNPKVYQAFSTVLGKKELWVSIDRYEYISLSNRCKFCYDVDMES
jgi:hypothetical protein